MRLGSQTRHVDLSFPTVNGATSPVDADILVSLRAKYDGFAGETTTWVPAPAWRSFVAALTELERTRQGHAELESWPFGDRIQLRIFSTDRAGHMAVTGMIESVILEEDAGSLVLNFGRIHFDPSTLPELVREVSTVALSLARDHR